MLGWWLGIGLARVRVLLGLGLATDMARVMVG